MSKSLINFYLIALLFVFLVSCNEKVVIDPYEKGYFSYKNKPFAIDSIKVVNLGYSNGKYTMEAFLTGDNDISIYIKYYSLTGDRYSRCSLNSGGDPLEKGNAPFEFSQSSYIIVNDSMEHLLSGWIRLDQNDVNHRTFEISTSTESSFLIGQYRGEINYSAQSDITTIDSVGTGRLTYLNDTVLISNGSMYYSGFDIIKNCYLYKLFLTNNSGNCYLKFIIYSPEELKAGSMVGINEINLFHGITQQSYSSTYSILTMSKKGIYERLQSGSINIAKDDGESYIINVNCTDHYDLKWNPVTCNYKGKIYFNDMNPL